MLFRLLNAFIEMDAAAPRDELGLKKPSEMPAVEPSDPNTSTLEGEI